MVATVVGSVESESGNRYEVRWDQVTRESLRVPGVADFRGCGDFCGGGSGEGEGVGAGEGEIACAK